MRADRLFNRLQILPFVLILVSATTFLAHQVQSKKVFNGAINILNSAYRDCVFRCFISESLLHIM